MTDADRDERRLEALCRAHDLTVEEAVLLVLDGAPGPTPEPDPLCGLLGNQEAGVPAGSQRHDDDCGLAGRAPHASDERPA